MHHKRHPLVIPKQLRMAVEEVPVQHGEGARIVTGALPVVVATARTGIAHPVNGVAGRTVRLQAQDAAVFGAALVYSILRYHISEGVAWAHFPLFILNKATSLSAVSFVACSYLIGRVIKWHNHGPQQNLLVISFAA